MLCDRSLSFFHSFCHSVNRITDERGNACRPNLAGTGKRWPSRSDWLLVVIQICAWIPDHLFIFFTNEEHLLVFICFLTSHTINSRFEPYLAKWMTPTSASTILGGIFDRNPNSNPGSICILASVLAQNRPLWRMMSTYGATQSWVARQKRRLQTEHL